MTFTLGDLQSEGAQLYFVGSPQLAERGGGYLRDASGVQAVRCIGGTIEYDDAARTIAPAQLRFATANGEELDVEIDAGVTEHQLRHGAHLRGARALALLADPRRRPVSGWSGRTRGWVEANRYGIA